MISFCERLFQDENEINIQWKTDKNWGNEIYFVEKNIQLDTLIQCFIHIFLIFRLNKAIETVIKKDYYFTDKEEIARIADLAKWIISEFETNDYVSKETVKMNELLYKIFKSNVENEKTVHFDSVIQFRMKDLRQYLINIVGLAIDEFKREEEHQDFLHSIREYINKREAKHEEVHIVQNDPFLFYKQTGERYTTDELRLIMSREPLYLIGLDENERNLAPLIALMPKHIYIYGDDSSEARTLSIINIFQERVTFQSYYKFPFQEQKGKS